MYIMIVTETVNGEDIQTRREFSVEPSRVIQHLDDLVRTHTIEKYYIENITKI